MKRVIFSILAGFLTSGILASTVDHVFHTTGIFPPYGEANFDHGLMLMAFLYRVLFGIAGAYITAALAKEHAHKAVFLLGGIGSILWLVGAILMWDFAPAWYNIIGIVTGIPITFIGKRIHQWKKKSMPHRAATLFPAEVG